MVLHHRGCPIRKSAGRRLFPPHRGLSQVITSFIGSQCQGIHLTLFFAWTAFCSPVIFPGNFRLFCLSFANNCLGCKLKDLLVLIHFLLSASDISICCWRNCFVFPQIRKNLLKMFSNKFFSKSTFVDFTTICFVSFFLFGFQWAKFFCFHVSHY